MVAFSKVDHPKAAPRPVDSKSIALVDDDVEEAVTVIVSSAELAAAQVVSAALVAVTVQVPALEAAVSVVPLIVQVPAFTANVTAPLPLPPVLDSVVVPDVATLLGVDTATTVAC